MSGFHGANGGLETAFVISLQHITADEVADGLNVSLSLEFQSNFTQSPTD